MSIISLPLCPTTCAGVLGVVSFDECAPEIHYGEISKIYLWELGDHPWGSEQLYGTPVGWIGVVDNDEVSSTGHVREMTVIGEMPEPEQTETPISGDRIVTGFKKFIVNFEIDETNEINYNYLLLSECGGKYSANFETADGILYGGMHGLEVTVKLNQVIPRERTGVVKIMGKMSWSSRKHPLRQISPVA
jgi:hypothetical protein